MGGKGILGREASKFKGIKRFHWIFDISPNANSKSQYEVCHECTEAVWIFIRSRLRG